MPVALCTTAQTATLPRGRIDPNRRDCGANHMLLIVGVVLVLIAFVIPMMRVSDSVNASPLGWMSAQWLAEHRASHER